MKKYSIEAVTSIGKALKEPQCGGQAAMLGGGATV